jgi:hypothetical protein
MEPEIHAYYGRGREDDRLATGQGVLPDPPARVLDVGGATGVYAA